MNNPMLLDQGSLDFVEAALIYLVDIKKQFSNLKDEFAARGLDASQIDRACVSLRNIDLDLQTRRQQHRQAAVNNFRMKKAARARAKNAAVMA
ncbi:hypothetical protein EV682_103305 [Iodobacter fluviatilis]|uniref:Uncharacterized protein n=2 Tax=Iodobacter fluviatilis TaxID=537 RepID=A0A377Q922_9NEIS|nr:hypothetical protein EV682_103305 [Iodobacter fluviatilis]STQ91208.1 Uncharacterised protein [Iodobacter fluviatilis]